jgi:NAD(P)H dehydrogenase (quinone)
MKMSIFEQIRRVLVHGANGVRGGAIARRLREEGFEVRGGVRDLARAALGIESVAADLDSPDALRSASEGMDAVVLTPPLGWDREVALRWARNATAAARAGRVGLLVLTSGTRLPAEPTDVPAFEICRALEAVVREAGLPTIILRPPFFMENLASPWITSGMARDQVVAYPVPDTIRAAWLAVADLGSYVAAALRRADLAGQVLDIGGPENLDGPGLARELSLPFGQPLRYSAVPPEVIERGLAEQMGPAVARGIARSYFWSAEHPHSTLFTGGSPELEPSRPLTRLARWARSQPWASAAGAPHT